MQRQKSSTNNWPHKVCDDEQLYNPVDDTHRPALHHHRLGGLIGEEICDAAPHPGAHGYKLVQVRYRWLVRSLWVWKESATPVQSLQESLKKCGDNVEKLTPAYNEKGFQTAFLLCVIKYLMAKLHCLSPPPSLSLFIGLYHELVLPFSYSNEDEETVEMSLPLSLAFFTTNPISCASFLSASFLH